MIKVLIVEDNEAIRIAMVDELIMEKFSVSQAVDGEEAFNKIISIKPDLVILDVSLPKMNGIDVLKKIRATPLVANTKVILFTNLEPDDKMIEDIAYLKPSFYLTKSNISFGELPEKIRETVNS